MSVNTLVKIENILGHYVEADITTKGYFGKTRVELVGRIIYSDYFASLFFKPKNSRNKGYLIENGNDVHSVKIIRKDKKKNEYYVNLYSNKHKHEWELQERLEREKRELQKQEEERRRQFELKRKKEQEERQREIEEAKNLGGYEKLEKEVIDFYKSFKNEYFNENLVKNTYIPILNKLIHKAINNVDEYPKHFFCKRNNPKFTKLIEIKLNLKLTNTQQKNTEILNKYLAEGCKI